MKIHYIQHVPFETIGCIAEWCDKQQHTVTGTHVYQQETFPSADQFDWLIVMGGPMSTGDEQQHPWLVAEKQCIAQAIAQGKVVLGICLGAQLIAEVLSARVYPNPQKEIGWFPITFHVAAHQSPLFDFVPATLDVFHWHGDTFDLPTGAVHLASSAACPNQAFVYQERVIGLQFHLEMTGEGIQAIVAHGADELNPAPYIQSTTEILAQNEKIAATNNIMFELLNRLQG